MNCANHPDRERVAFCQNCGKPLCEECKRTIGSSVFCEPCFAVRSGAGTPPPPGFPGYTGPPAGYTAGVSPRHPEPVVAALLGFIPGVGAMYNEQYAKGIVHLIVFAILVSLTNTTDVFGWFVAGCHSRICLTTSAPRPASSTMPSQPVLIFSAYCSPSARCTMKCTGFPSRSASSRSSLRHRARWGRNLLATLAGGAAC